VDGRPGNSVNRSSGCRDGSRGRFDVPPVRSENSIRSLTYPWESKAQTPKTTDCGRDRKCRLTCSNVTEGHWLDECNPIR
jgi:hypothetical protein